MPKCDVILKWSHFLGITPPFRQEKFHRSNFYIFWIAIHLSTLCAFFCIFWVFTNIVTLLVDTFQAVLNTLNTLVLTAQLWHFKVGDLQRIFSSLQAVQKELKIEVLARKYVACLFVLVNLAIIMPSFTLWCFMYYNKPLPSLLLFSVTVIMHYCHLHGILQVYILDRVEATYSEINAGFDKLCNCEDGVMKLLKAHKYLSAAMDGFNDLFGWNIFLHIVSSVLILIEETYMVLLRFTCNDLRHAFSFTLPLCIIITVHVTVLANKSESLMAQNKRLLKNISSSFIDCKGESQRRNLLALKQDVDINRPKVSAAGFLEVNHAMLFMMFNMIITDLIAVAQFDFTKFDLLLNNTQN